jgi:hypothetical protein
VGFGALELWWQENEKICRQITETPNYIKRKKLSIRPFSWILRLCVLVAGKQSTSD